MGKVIKYILRCLNKNDLALIQCFITYASQFYFIAQIEILNNGKEIATNYISPLNLEKVVFYTIENFQTVFIKKIVFCQQVFF